ERHGLRSDFENELNFIEKNRDKVSDYLKDKRELFDKEKDFKNEINGLETKLAHNQEQYSDLYSELSRKMDQIEQKIKEIEDKINSYLCDEKKYEDFTKTSPFKVIEDNQETSKTIKNGKVAVQIIEDITDKYYLTKEKQDELKTSIDKFLSHFSEGNIFSFPSKLPDTS
ncbi:hypothetical protein, partial [Echinicola sediminis]